MRAARSASSGVPRCRSVWPRRRPAADIWLWACAIGWAFMARPRFFSVARERGLRPIIGAELEMDDGSVLPVLVESRTAYRNLCRLLTRAHLRAAKNEGVVRWDELPEFASGLVALSGDEEGPLHRAVIGGDPVSPEDQLHRLRRVFGNDGVFVEIQRHLRCGED